VQRPEQRELLRSQGRFDAEWTALFDKVSVATHGAKEFHAPWANILSGPNDVIVYSKAQLPVQDVADRLLKV
jgi:hypothetical protein